jgi:hypothetical protein
VEAVVVYFRVLTLEKLMKTITEKVLFERSGPSIKNKFLLIFYTDQGKVIMVECSFQTVLCNILFNQK